MLRTAIVLSGLVLATGPAIAADWAGTATDVRTTARAEGADGTDLRFLEARGAIFTGDRITTDRTGQAEIELADDTRMVVGPNSQITIDQFVYQTRSTARQVALKAVRGAFRFITGRSAKEAYSIAVPAGTIGVRGTALDLTVHDDGSATFALYEGGVRYCDRAEPRRCLIVDEPCSVMRIAPTGEIARVGNVYERTNVLDEEMPYAFRQRRLNWKFRIATGSCEIRDATGAPTSEDTSSRQTAPAGGGRGGKP